MPPRLHTLRQAAFVRSLPRLLLAACAVIGLVSASSAAAATSGPTVGLIAPSASQLSALKGSSLTRVVLGLGWANAEPRNGVFDANVFGYLSSAIHQAHLNGLDVVLDLGLQYPPSWVFSLPGQTRFVNQYGDIWHGVQSEDVPNAVFNTSVRAAEANYLAHLAAALDPHSVASIRVGGLMSGELRYPSAKYNGHTLSLWMYDAAAQHTAPYPGWKPGSGTPGSEATTEANASLSYYFNKLTSYQTWLMKTVNKNFPDVDQQILLPSWGLRPGLVDKAVTAGLHNTTTAEVNGLISEGLDWPNQVKAITTSGIRGTIYTTWLDAPTQGTTVQQVPPVAYLATLAAAYRLPLAGENTGGGGSAALNLSLQRARQFGLSSVMYMSGTLISQGTAGISLDQLKAAAAAT